jgi:hypothetical protein
MSTRDFLLDRSIFDDGKISLPVSRPGLRAVLGAASKAALGKGDRFFAPAETQFALTMERLNLLRVDFLGTAPGMWSLHPPLRCPAFYRALPDIIRRIEADEIPDEQRGDYDLNGSIVECREPAAGRSLVRWVSRHLPS